MGNKREENFIENKIKDIIYNHIKEYCKLNDINLIKGESSHWINKSDLINQKFEWAKEYFAVSVSESNIQKIREYIKIQDEHHRKINFKEEYHEFMVKYGFEKFRPKG